VKLAKCSLKERVTAEHQLLLGPAVRKEAVDQGKAGGHADALLIEQNLEAGRLRMVAVPRIAKGEAAARALGLDHGEADTLRLVASGEADLALSDDRRFLRVLEDLGLPYATSAALLRTLVEDGRIERGEGLRYLDRLSPMISEEEYLETRAALED